MIKRRITLLYSHVFICFVYYINHQCHDYNISGSKENRIHNSSMQIISNLHLLRDLRNIRWACNGASAAPLYIAADSCWETAARFPMTFNFYWLLPSAYDIPTFTTGEFSTRIITKGGTTVCFMCSIGFICNTSLVAKFSTFFNID